jgi:hypothetical protein
LSHRDRFWSIASLVFMSDSSTASSHNATSTRTPMNVVSNPNADHVASLCVNGRPSICATMICWFDHKMLGDGLNGPKSPTNVASASTANPSSKSSASALIGIGFSNVNRNCRRYDSATVCVL